MYFIQEPYVIFNFVKRAYPRIFFFTDQNQFGMSY